MDQYQPPEMYGRPQITPHQHTSQYPYALPPQHSLSYASESSSSGWGTPGASFFASEQSSAEFSEPSSVGSLSHTQSGSGTGSGFDQKFSQSSLNQLDHASRYSSSGYDTLQLPPQPTYVSPNFVNSGVVDMGGSPAQAFEGYTEQQQQFQAMMAQHSMLENEIRPRNGSLTAFASPALERYERDQTLVQAARRNSTFMPYASDASNMIGTMAPPPRPSQRGSMSVDLPPPPRMHSAPTSPTMQSASQVYGAYGSSYIAATSPVMQTLPPPSPASFSMNPTAPSDPFDAAALGLPVPQKTSTNWTGVYSNSGFDMVSVLSKVASRPNPQLALGPIDFSCSFVVVDAKKWDQPIVFASDTFSRLTGYSNAEIIGRNCRFLQAPDGVAVRQGEKRKYTDGNAAYHLRRHLITGQESQASLINYCKGGKPFINLVTIIPITWDSDDIAYYVGFQVDLVEQPSAIVEKTRDGAYVVNYSLSANSIPPLIEPPHVEPFGELHSNPAPGAKDPTVELIDTVSEKGTEGLVTELSRKQFNKVLLEHCDDFVHVLSLKGSLLYVSPSAKRLLEYDPVDLVGKGLSTICHPSDIVSVLRELKEAGPATPISIVYRVRRKSSGYMWLEATGRLHLEQGKGRKCVILVGRPREVYRMSWSDLERQGGFGSTEYWSKWTVRGLCLYATPNVKTVLERSSEEMTGKTLTELSPNGDATQVLAALQQAARGQQATVRHHMLAKSTMVDVVTHFYPAKSDSDAPPSSTSSFAGNESHALIAQTNLFSSEVTKSRNVSLPSAPSSRNSMEMAQSVAPVAFTLPAFGGGGSGGSGSDSDGSNGGGAPGKTSFAAIPSTFKTLSHDNASDNVFDELDSVRGTSWQFELHQMRLTNKKLREEKEALLALQRSKKRKRGDAGDRLAPPGAKSPGSNVRRCANCGRSQSAEWRSGPTGPKTLCNACGLRWSKARPSASASSHHGSTTSSESPNSGSSRGPSRLSADSTSPSE